MTARSRDYSVRIYDEFGEVDAYTRLTYDEAAEIAAAINTESTTRRARVTLA